MAKKLANFTERYFAGNPFFLVAFAWSVIGLVTAIFFDPSEILILSLIVLVFSTGILDKYLSYRREKPVSEKTEDPKF